MHEDLDRADRTDDHGDLPLRPVPTDDGPAPDAAPADSADPGDGGGAARVLGVRFRCEKLSCTLTERACGDRHRRATEDARLVGPRALTTLWGSPCLRCELGARNAGVDR